MPAMMPLFPDEIKRVLATFDDNNIRDKTLFILGVSTGFRISELLSLTISDVANKRGIIYQNVTVTLSKMKAKKYSRTVPLNPDSIKAIDQLLRHLKPQRRLKPHYHLFQSRQGKKGTAITKQQAHNVLKKAFNQAELNGRYSTHTLRKSFAEQCRTIFKGDIVKISKALGHKNIQTTIRYLSFIDDEIKQGIRSISLFD